MRTLTWKVATVAAAALLSLPFLVSPATAQSQRAYLGVYLSDLSDGTRRALGLDEDLGILVERVSSDGPAAEAGMKGGDVIVAIEGREIDGQSGLNRALRKQEPGDEIAVIVWRAGERVPLSVTLGRQRGLYYSYSTDSVPLVTAEAPEAPAIVWGSDETPGFFFGNRRQLGIRTQELNGQLAEYFGVTHGVLVTWVTRQSAARNAGMLAGDVVTELAGEPVHRERDLVLILQELRGEDSVELRVMRKGQGKKLTVTFDD